MGVVDLFPFLWTANSLHSESLAFSTVCFSQELKFSSTFRKHELNKQGVFLALLLSSPQVCVGEHMRVWPPILVFSSHFYSVSVSLSHYSPHWPYAFLFYLSLRTKFELASSLTSLRPVWQALKGMLGTFSRWNCYWQQGWRDISWWMISIGESHEANELAGISLCPTSSGTDE